MNWIKTLQNQFNSRISLKEKRAGIYQLFAPFYHEDGDMLDIFIEKNGDKTIRVCDSGMTLMRLSYTYSLDTPNKEKIFYKIIGENKVNESKGNLYIDTPIELLYPTILQFAQAIAKVSNMRIYKREVIRSLFYELLEKFIDEKLKKFNPTPHAIPISDRDDLEVDYQFNMKRYPVFLFGVKDSAKARLVTISCLEFQRVNINFKSFVVHEDFDDLNKKDSIRITSAVDKQFTSLDDFKSNSIRKFELEAAY